MRVFFSILAIVALGPMGYAGAAAADCSPNTQVKGDNLRNALSNQVVCVGDPNNPNQRWSIWHQGGTGGTMTEWARGVNHPIDPSQDKGSWSLNTPGQGQGNNTNWETVTYDYGGGGSYTYSLHGSPGSQSLCSNGTALPIYAIVDPNTGTENVCGWPAF